MAIFQSIRNWAEVWAFFAPLVFVWLYHKKIAVEFKPIVIYIFIGFILNLCSTSLFVYRLNHPGAPVNNNVFYNLHSIARVIFFSWFLYNTRVFHTTKLFKIVFSLYALILIANFGIIQSFLDFSTTILISETVLLITLCTSYFYQVILDDETNWLKKPSFLLVAGLFFFEMINFFVYLFYTPVGNILKMSLRRSIWTVHNISLVLFCIIIALAIKNESKRKNILDEQP